MAAKRKCPICSSTKVSVDRPEVFEYTDCGLHDVQLVGNGVTVISCDSCGQTTTSVQDEQQLLQVLGLMIVTAPPGMTGQQVRFLRTLMGVTQAELAASLGDIRRETIAEWEAKDRIYERPYQEVGLRLVLVSFYLEKIIKSDRCFLSKDHVDEFCKFIDTYTKHIQKIIAATKSQRKMEIKRRPRRGEWQPQLSFA